jgi:tRNA (pseudouridine54-N1)-methyltransferase
MTREFILLALKAPTTPDFDLNNMPKEGRIDLVCRTISNSLYVSMAMRKDTIIHVCLNGAPTEQSPKTITFQGEFLEGMEWDERSVAKFLQKALTLGLSLKLGEEKQVQPGLKISKKAFETLIREKSEQENKQLIYLNEKGADIREFIFEKEKDVVFILGDFLGIPKNTEKLMKRLEFEKASLGPVMLLASHCPILVHNELDRRNL